jgi:DNA polymerase-3 subunit beta
MKFTISRDEFLKPLQHVAGVVEKRQTLAVLSNVLLVVDKHNLSMTGTDMEIELVTNTAISGDIEPGEITIPAKKLLDICKSLPADAELELSTQENRALLKSGRSRFSLVTLPASDFPNLDEYSGATAKFEISSKELKTLVESTSFAMAQQDVRYYLNGMLFEIKSDSQLKAVATDGHRLALSHAEISMAGEANTSSQAIVPRKSVLELARLFIDEENSIEITLGNNYIQGKTQTISFSSKLVDGKFPDYDRVIPKGGDKIVAADREELRFALNRVAILSNDKFRGVRLILEKGNLQLIANNPEQEQAEENVAVDYDGPELEIGFNVSYLLDVMNTIREDQIEIVLTDSNSSGVVRGSGDENSLYVVMPMRL